MALGLSRFRCQIPPFFIAYHLNAIALSRERSYPLHQVVIRRIVAST